jgi:prevent-host-death family protein
MVLHRVVGPYAEYPSRPSALTEAKDCDRRDRVDEQMTRIMVMSETLSLATVKSKFSEMVDRVEHTHDRIIVTRNGRPAAVLISPEELESLEDTLELLSDPDAMRQLDESRQAYAAGDFVTGDELRSRYLTK